jgi:uncharacterized protein with von Willebrand factor type A (vWA) domain
VNDGKEWNIDELKSRMAKAKQMQNKNKNTNIFEPKAKRMVNLEKFEGNIIKRARELGLVKQKKVNNDILSKFYDRVKNVKKINTRTKKGKLEYESTMKEIEQFYSLNSELYGLVNRGDRQGLSPEEAYKLINIANEISRIQGVKNINIYKDGNAIRYYGTKINIV